MRTIGLRELKDNLSRYVRQVREGEALLVTDRGEVVAELRRPFQVGESGDPYPGLTLLAQRGLLRVGSANTPEVYPSLTPLLPPGSSAALLDEERGER